jgi:hypothetical protein
VAEGEGPSLLLQFILNELITQEKSTPNSCDMGAFGWTQPGTSLDRLREHISLLSIAFPTIDSAEIQHNLHLPKDELIKKLKPFILSLKENGNLLHFLLKTESHPSIHWLLEQIGAPIESLKSYVAAHMKSRGYKSV